MSRWMFLLALVPAAASAGTTKWAGTYACAQGATALKLTVIDDDPARITAVFAFGPSPANPAVARGAFTLRGERRGGLVELRPDAWLEQPADYDMVGLSGRMAGDRFEGRILHETCAGFSLQRQPG